MDHGNRKKSFTLPTIKSKPGEFHRNSISGDEKASSAIKDVLSQIQKQEFENEETTMDINKKKQLVAEKEKEVKELETKNAALEAEYLKMQAEFNTSNIHYKQKEIQLEVWRKLIAEKERILAETKEQWGQKEEEIRRRRIQFCARNKKPSSIDNSQDAIRGLQN